MCEDGEWVRNRCRGRRVLSNAIYYLSSARAGQPSYLPQGYTSLWGVPHHAQGCVLEWCKMWRWKSGYASHKAAHFVELSKFHLQGSRPPRTVSPSFITTSSLKLHSRSFQQGFNEIAQYSAASAVKWLEDTDIICYFLLIIGTGKHGLTTWPVFDSSIFIRIFIRDGHRPS